MRTTITIPDTLFREVQGKHHTDTPSRTIIRVFQDFLRRQKARQLMSKAGNVEMTIDRKKLRELRDAR